MAGSVNKVILIGNLGKDPEVKYLEQGRGFAKFTMATSEVYKDKNGERKEQTEWHNISVWRPGLVEVVEKYLKKGQKVYVEGKLRNRSWEDEEKITRYITEIVVDNLTMLTPLTKDETSGQNSNQPSSNAIAAEKPTENTVDDNGPDDDLPF